MISYVLHPSWSKLSEVMVLPQAFVGFLIYWHLTSSSISVFISISNILWLKLDCGLKSRDIIRPGRIQLLHDFCSLLKLRINWIVNWTI